MKTSVISLFLSAVVSASKLNNLSCAASCVQKIALVDGCAQTDLACHCSKVGAIKQLQPCLESACTDAETLNEAKEAYTQACGSAGIVVRFSPDKRRRDNVDGMPEMEGMGSSSATGAGPSSDMAGMSMGSPSSSTSLDEDMAAEPEMLETPSAGGVENKGTGMSSSGSASSGSSGSTPAAGSSGSGHAGMDMSTESSSAGAADAGMDILSSDSKSGHEGMAMGSAASSVSSVATTPTTVVAAKPLKAWGVVTTTTGARGPAMYTGAAVPQDVRRGLLGLAAAIAVVVV